MSYEQLSPSELVGPPNNVEEKNAPSTLYVAGDRQMFREGPRVSVVGSRNASPGGLARARKLSRILVENRIIVVSGLAAGIDTAAHWATIEAGGRTIAVLGTPLDDVHPKENAELQETIKRDHLCVSQFHQGQATNKSSFPLRNRTMALLSDATVIIEAGNKSGTTHQGWEALRLGRPLFITQHTVEDQALTWPNEMLEYGAHVLRDSTIDLLLDLLPIRSRDAANDSVPF